MKIQLDKFHSVDLCYQMYRELIKIWEITTPSTKYNKPVLFTYNPAVFARLLLTSYSAQISRINERILDLEDTQKINDYNKKISDFMNSIPAFAKIKAKVTLTPQEVKQKIKNALAHAEYDLIYENNVKIIIDTDYIQGEIPLEDMDELYRFYNSICDELDLTNICYTGLNNFFNLSTNNINILKNSINNIGINNKINNISIPKILLGNMTVISLDFDITSTPLSQNNKKLLFDYIRYVGLSNWVKLPSSYKQMIFTKHFRYMIEDKCNFRNSPQYIQDTLDNLIFHGKGKTTDKDIYNLSFQSPNIYAGLILDQGFLCLNYIKEALAKENLPNFNYRNIDLKNIKYTPSNCVKLVTAVEEQQKLSGIINDLQSKSNRLAKSINKKLANIQNINKATSLTEESRKEKIENIQKNINEEQKLLNETNEKLNILNNKYNNATDYYETNDFFKHLRNSISHGFYNVDYSQALEKKDLSKIIFKFQDWDIDKNNRKNKKLVFEAEITANKLIYLFEQLQTRLKQSYDTIEKSETKLLYYDDLRKRKDTNKDAVDNYLTGFKEKGFTLKKIKI